MPSRDRRRLERAAARGDPAASRALQTEARDRGEDRLYQSISEAAAAISDLCTGACGGPCVHHRARLEVTDAVADRDPVRALSAAMLHSAGGVAQIDHRRQVFADLDLETLTLSYALRRLGPADEDYWSAPETPRLVAAHNRRIRHWEHLVEEILRQVCGIRVEWKHGSYSGMLSDP